MQRAKLVNGDSRNPLIFPNTGTVDLVICSPPYKDEDAYSDNLMREVFTYVCWAMREGALCFVNFGHLAGHKTRPFRVAQILEDTFGDLRETFIWVKNHYRPIQGERRVNNLFEYIFMFSKGPMPKLDRLAVGVPYADKSNINRFADGQDLKCGGNVWHIPYETVTSKDQKLHNDRFPAELPERCIKLAGLPANSLVFDPFMGSGTTGVAALELGHRFHGIELSPEHFATAQARLEEFEQAEQLSE